MAKGMKEFYESLNKINPAIQEREKRLEQTLKARRKIAKKWTVILLSFLLLGVGYVFIQGVIDDGWWQATKNLLFGIGVIGFIFFIGSMYER